MYLHKKHIHPSVLAVMEREGHKQVNVPASVRKTVSCKVIGESLVLEGYTSTGKKLVVEADRFDPELNGPALLIETTDGHAFALNTKGEYEIVDEGVVDMVKGAIGGFKKMWGKFKAGLAKLFGKPGDADSFMKKYNQDPKGALAGLKQHMLDKGIDPAEVDKKMATITKSMASGKDTIEKIKNKDPGTLASMKAVGDAQTPEQEQAAKQKFQQDADRAHELAMAKAQGDRPVVAGGGAGAQGKPGADGKPGPDGKTPAAATPPASAAPAADPAAAAAPAPAAAPAGPKEGDKVEKTDAAGKKIEGQVITVDEAGAKKWNDQFAGKAGFIGIKAGPVVKTASGFVPLDKDWQVAAAPDPATAAPAPAAKPAATPAPAAAPTPATPAAPPEVKPVPPADGSTPTSIPPAAAPDPAATGLTGAEQGPGPAAPAPDQDQAGQPAAEPAFDPNATMAQPAAGPKPGIPAGMKKSKIVNGKRVVGERLMTMAEINRLLRGTK